MKYRKALERSHVTCADVTWKELKELGSKKGVLTSIFDFLHSFWVGEHASRETNVRIGTVNVDFDKDGFLHLDFATRFRLNEEERTAFIEELQQAERRNAKEWLDKFVKKQEVA
jgi:hypothetical protein